MARRRRRRVPEVLRRAYHGRARTLEETILSLLPRPPPSPSDCRCGGRICLGCAGSTHLLREDDSTEYRLLLTRAFCVLSSDAPPPPVDHLCSGSSQRSGTTKIKQEKLIYLLKEHLKHNIVKLGQNFYLQKIGIPQGSLLSSLLCSFYYGHLESCQILPCLEKTLEHPNPNCWINTDTSNLDEEQLRLSLGEQSSVCNHTSIDSMGVGKSQCPFPEYMLLRLIDDFLFISTSKKQATCFVNRLKRGFKNWSGLLLNCRTLEVQADYTRYCGIHMSSTITVHVHTKPAQQLKEKLCDYMRPKCHPIFYDSRINSPPVVSLNAYQAFLLCAMKFHCYTCSMPDITNRNPSYLQEIIERSIRYMYKLIKKRMHELKHNSNGIKPNLVLKKADIVWLGLSAYVRILGKKQSRHKDLLWLLKCKLAAHGKVCNISSHLEYAVDDSHSSMFWEIRF